MTEQQSSSGVVDMPPVRGLDVFEDASLAGRLAAVHVYLELGWVVVLENGQVRLSLDDGPVVIGLPEALAVEVTEILLTRRCSPAVLRHPAVPSYQVFVVPERFPVALGWPPTVRRLTTGSVPLPPSRTSHGPVQWIRPPHPGATGLCREIDLVAALRTLAQNHTAQQQNPSLDQTAPMAP